MSDSHQRRSVFFALRGVLGFILLALLASHHTLVSPLLWLLAIAFLASNLLIPVLPETWFRRPGAGYAMFFVDLACLTYVLYSVAGIDTESLLLYYLTVFMATVGEDLRKSVAIALVATCVYFWLRLNQGAFILGDSEALLRIPLFFATAVSCGYLAQEVRSQKREVRELKDAQQGLNVEIGRVVQDLEESERLRRSAETSERRYRNLVEDLDAIVWEADAATSVFTFISQQAEAILGHPIGQWHSVQEFCARFVHPEDRRRFSTLSKQAVLAGRNHEFEFRALAADGRAVWLRNIVRVSRDAEGRAQQVRGLMVDLTDAKQAEEAIDRLRRQNELILNSAGEGIYGLDLDGRATFVNPAAAEMLGWDTTELIGRPMHALIHHSRADRTPYPVEECPIQAAFEDGTVRQVDDEVFWRKDGTSFPVEYFSTPMRNERGEVVGAVVAFRDITARKFLEQQLRHSQKMEAVGRLAGGVAHDFNNLLTVITGYTELMLDYMGRDSPLRGHGDEILKAGRRAASLTRQLLAFSRQQVMAPCVIELNAVVANVEKMLRRLIGEDIDLAIIPGEDLGQVKADPGQIEQVIMNLAVNARDAMPQGGKLTIETGNVDLDETYAQTHFPVSPGRYTLLAVCDTGCGMDKETLARIFEPFFTTKEEGKGTGLGLATVYGIVKQSGGFIWVYSEPGQGTTFKIYLPRIEDGEKNSQAAVIRGTLRRGTETILLVEDEEGVRSLARGILESNGYTVLTASRGGEAIEIAERHDGSIHLILTDVVMPEMSGRDLTERLAAIHPETKVLYMSGYTDDAIVRHGVLDYNTAFLQKPFSPDGLARKVREVLDTPQPTRIDQESKSNGPKTP